TPVANSITTLTYTRSGGGQVPPARKVYSINDPVSLASTDLTGAAMTILAKYDAACWVAADALKEYLTPAAAAAGDYVRGISNSGFGSTIEGPMEAINWLNQDAGSLRGSQAPAPLAVDSNGFKAMDFTVYGRLGLLCKKLSPVVAPGPSNDNYRFPAVRMPFNLKDSHFMMALFRPTTAGSDGVLVAAQEILGSQHTAIRVLGGQIKAEVTDSTGRSDGLLGGVPTLNALTLATLTSEAPNNLIRLRVNGSAALSVVSDPLLAASNYSTISVGYGYWDSYPQQAVQCLHYGAIVGAGVPTEAELTVLGQYLTTFAQAPVAPLTGAEAIIQGKFDAGNAGFWGSLASLTYFWNSAVDHTHPSAFGTVGSPIAAAVWINRGNPINGHDYIENNLTNAPVLSSDGADNFYKIYAPSKVVGAGASSTKWHLTWTADFTTYECVLASDRNAAHKGFRLRYSGDTDKFYLDVGRVGSTTVTLELATPWAGTFAAPGKHVLEAWYDGTNIGLRLDRSAVYVATVALGGAVDPGAADLMLAGDWDGSSPGVINSYDLVVLKNDEFVLADRNTVATYSGAKAHLTV